MPNVKCMRCLVPQCRSSYKDNPGKRFAKVPLDPIRRKKWLDLARVYGSIENLVWPYMCEDHFNLDEDVTNLTKLDKSLNRKLVLHETAVPSKFHCQENYTALIHAPDSDNSVCQLDSTSQDLKTDSLAAVVMKKNEMATTTSTGQRKGSELEKFKRRMIRSVARRIKEKKSDDELWEEMKKEIGSNCKKLWTRMRMLTLKKLKRLLEADDRVDLIGPVARMTLTDWLLFDLVIVHEKIDVIGRDALSEERTSAVLNNLFSLVQRFQIEGRRGENLAEAWTAATVYYNSKGHQCSPMILQRRWFQLKELTRHKFYKFWFNYRGNQRQLITAKQDSPNELQKAIALRYPQIVTHKFLTWEEGIAQRLVILPDELGVKMRQRNLMKPSDTSAPDVVLIEPQVETIDLGNISDSDDEEDQSQGSDTQPTVKVKSEPIDIDQDEDVDVEYQIPPEKGSEFEEEIARLQMVEEHFDEESCNAENSVVDDSKQLDPDDFPSDIANEDSNFADEDEADDDTILIDDDEDVSNPQESITEPVTTNPVKITVDTNTEETDSIGVIAEISAVASGGIKVENVDEVVERSRLNDEVQMLPVISNVSGGGVKLEQNLLVPEEMSINNEYSITNIKHENISQNNVAETLPVISTISSKGVKVEMDVDASETDNILTEDNSVENPVGMIVEMHKTEPEDLEEFDEANIFNIADDGIEFADDGIAYVEDDEDSNKSPKDSPKSDVVKTEEITDQTDDDDGDEDDTIEEQTDAQKFDLKLLMYPVVYTTKLDAMPFVNVLNYEQVYCKETIDKIYALSKPRSKQSVTGSEQVVTTNDSNDIKEEEANAAMSDDDLFSNEAENPDSDNKSIVDDSKRVKMSSYMLQKPKNRSYNPVLLCKNPDFNTRLKKLTVGFLMSARNRTLLHSCIPMTIDMSKAFEDKLINGTLYLKNTSQDTTVVNPQDVEMTSAQLIKPTTVEQSMMCIDDTLENELRKRMQERVRGINLPDINQVRRLNQHLLTAEVVPLRSQGNTLNRIGPASYIQKVKDDIEKILKQQKGVADSNPDSVVTEKIPVQPQKTPPIVTIDDFKVTSEPILQKVSTLENNTDTTPQTDDQNASAKLPKTRKVPRRKKYPTLAWNRPNIANQANQEIHKSDALLTIDTLYKMLSALDPNIKKKPTPPKKKVTEEKYIFPSVTDDVNKKTNKNSEKTNTVINLIEDEAPAKKLKHSRKPIRLEGRNYCCWYSYKLDYAIGNLPAEKSKRRHKHKKDDCNCCCKQTFLNNRSLKHADLTIAEKNTRANLNIAIDSVIEESKPQQNTCDPGVLLLKETRPIKQTTDTGVQIDSGDDVQVKSVTDSTSNAVVTKTSETMKVQAPNSSSDVTAELTPMPRVRVYTAKHSDTSIVQFPIKNKPDAITEKYLEHRRRYLTKILTSEPNENKSKSNLLNSKLCTCRQFISKVDQGHIEINGKLSCSVHKSKVIQKQIYVNTKNDPKDKQPFFVGKDKILLTNVRMPKSDHNYTATSAAEETATDDQPNEVRSLSVPAGVQIILLPNGTLTYVVEAGVTLTPEETTLMPQFLAAIQQQLNVIGGTTLQASLPAAAGEVIDLVEEKSPNKFDNQKENVTNLEENVENLSSESVHGESTNEGNDSEVVKVDNVLSKEATENFKKNEESISSRESIEAIERGTTNGSSNTTITVNIYHKKKDTENKIIDVNKKTTKNNEKNNTTFINLTEDEAPAKKPKYSRTAIYLKDRNYCCWFSYTLDYSKGNLSAEESKRRHKCKKNDCKCCCKKNYLSSRFLQRALKSTVAENITQDDQNIAVVSVLEKSKRQKQTCDTGVQNDSGDDVQVISVDGKLTCSVQKSKVIQKQIYVNTKNNPKDKQPFFVGKDKILLTNVRMPKSDDKKTATVSSAAEETATDDQPNEVRSVSVPAGVQIILLPDQTLTYVVEAGVTLTPEETALMPQFLAAIQQQLNVIGGTTLQASLPAAAGEVIDLVEEKSANELDTQKDNETYLKENVDNLSCEPVDGKSSNEGNDNDVVKVDQVLSEEAKENVEKNEECISSVEIIEAMEIGTTNGNSNTTINENIATDEDASSVNDPKPSADEVMNKKSLLSDLMEMSGIMEEDLAPAPSVIATPAEPMIIDTQNLVLQIEVPRDTTQSVKVLENPQTKSPTKSDTALNNEYELVAVTSLTDLKYSCENNGVFFKLDLKTGSLKSINVCIQKFPTKAKTKINLSTTQPIDLTDDPDISIAGTTESDSSTNEKSLIHNPDDKVDEQSQLPNKIQIASILKKKQRLMGRLSNNLKPINVQHSKKYVPSILKRNRFLLRDSQLPFYSKKKLDRIDAKIDLVDYDAPMEDEYVTSDSSDDEPLSKKVKRKRDDEQPNSSNDKASNEQNQTVPGSELDTSTLDQPIQNKSVDEQSNVETEKQNESNAKTSEENSYSQEDCDVTMSHDQDQEDYLGEDSDDENQSDEPMPVPTNLLLSGGAFNAHNIPLNNTYKDGDESQEEDCILGV